MRWHRIEKERRRFSRDRVKTYPGIRKAYYDIFNEIVVLLPKKPAKFWKKDAERRTEEEEKLVEAYKDIVCLMRQSYGRKKHHRFSTDWNFYCLAYRDAFILANNLDDDYTLWKRLSYRERAFFRGFTALIDLAKKRAGVRYDSDLAFTAGQFGSILRHMEDGKATPVCAR